MQLVCITIAANNCAFVQQRRTRHATSTFNSLREASRQQEHPLNASQYYDLPFTKQRKFDAHLRQCTMLISDLKSSFIVCKIQILSVHTLKIIFHKAVTINYLRNNNLINVLVTTS